VKFLLWISKSLETYAKNFAVCACTKISPSIPHSLTLSSFSTPLKLCTQIIFFHVSLLLSPNFAYFSFSTTNIQLSDFTPSQLFILLTYASSTSFAETNLLLQSPPSSLSPLISFVLSSTLLKRENLLVRIWAAALSRVPTWSKKHQESLAFRHHQLICWFCIDSPH